MKFIKKSAINNNFSERNKSNLVIQDNEKYENEVFIFTLFLECIYAFWFGYNLFFIENNFKELMALFISTLLIAICFIKLPYELLKGIIFKLNTRSNEIILKYSFLRFYYHLEIKGYTEKGSIIFSLIIPMLFLTILPSIISYILGFNVIAYAIAIACSIISARDFIDLLYLIKWVPNEGRLKHIENNYVLK